MSQYTQKLIKEDEDLQRIATKEFINAKSLDLEVTVEGNPANLPTYASLDNNIFKMEYPHQTRQWSNCFHFGHITRKYNNSKMLTNTKEDVEDSAEINVGENILEGNGFDISENYEIREDEDSGKINNSEKIKEKGSTLDKIEIVTNREDDDTIGCKDSNELNSSVNAVNELYNYGEGGEKNYEEQSESNLSTKFIKGLEDSEMQLV
ncbi:unnamed protein product [Lepeophtheirus salmonis]|uniref:(salmon louse) hypothetical protein n=1 Tax=Lepeophtheirus salmonis TaxID=72036 RepID=A0A7R8CTL4_LEPSM|nr:unnamed protein product [Lepeophtheirus salmonis]CAF2927295.1 unnamed protein product [Lepeophtheirus salmonis]